MPKKKTQTTNKHIFISNKKSNIMNKTFIFLLVFFSSFLIVNCSSSETDTSLEAETATLKNTIIQELTDIINNPATSEFNDKYPVVCEGPPGQDPFGICSRNNLIKDKVLFNYKIDETFYAREVPYSLGTLIKEGVLLNKDKILCEGPPGEFPFGKCVRDNLSNEKKVIVFKLSKKEFFAEEIIP